MNKIGDQNNEQLHFLERDQYALEAIENLNLGFQKYRDDSNSLANNSILGSSLKLFQWALKLLHDNPNRLEVDPTLEFPFDRQDLFGYKLPNQFVSVEKGNEKYTLRLIVDPRSIGLRQILKFSCGDLRDGLSRTDI